MPGSSAAWFSSSVRKAGWTCGQSSRHLMPFRFAARKESLEQVSVPTNARLPEAEILIFTMHDSDVLVGELLEAGARAYLLKSDAKQYLIAAVEALAEHKPFFTGRV